MIFSLDTSAVATAGSSASEIALAMGKRQYRLAASPAAGIWFRIVTPGDLVNIAAVATAGSHYLAPGGVVEIAAIATRTAVSVIREGGTNAVVCLSEIVHVDS
jgi:hypothetical protein